MNPNRFLLTIQQEDNAGKQQHSQCSMVMVMIINSLVFSGYQVVWLSPGADGDKNGGRAHTTEGAWKVM